jgi:hypothetical protein
MLFFVRDWSTTWSTHPTRMILSSSMLLLLNIALSLTFLNVILNGLKQDTYNGYRTCDVSNGKVIMSNPNSCACYITYGVTWLPYPSKTNKCQLVRNTPPKTNLLKKVKNSLNKKEIILVLFCIVMHIPSLENLM